MNKKDSREGGALLEALKRALQSLDFNQETTAVLEAIVGLIIEKMKTAQPQIRHHCLKSNIDSFVDYLLQEKESSEISHDDNRKWDTYCKKLALKLIPNQSILNSSNYMKNMRARNLREGWQREVRQEVTRLGGLSSSLPEVKDVHVCDYGRAKKMLNGASKKAISDTKGSFSISSPDFFRSGM